MDSYQLSLETDWMFRYSPGKIASFVLFLMGITDLLDGYFARLWDIETLTGKFLDPVADKLVLLVGLVLLMQLGRVSSWLVILLLSREFLITALRGIAIGEGVVIAAGASGKWKLVLQMLGMGFVMWYGSLFGFSAFKIGTAFLYAALIISFVSGYNYLSEFFAQMKKKIGSV
jgi:CDP-diacylglycerol--glycerol-3-phosphate 3-phosphatidyltransferase